VQDALDEKVIQQVRRTMFILQKDKAYFSPNERTPQVGSPDSAKTDDVSRSSQLSSLGQGGEHRFLSGCSVRARAACVYILHRD
jgi:hypothetical protein